jgi:hypothetical protein
VVLLARGEKSEQAHAFLLDRRLVLPPDRIVKRGDDQRRSRLLFDRFPARPDEPVDEDRALHDPVAAEEAEVLAGRQDAGTVGVGEKDVVVVREESDRDGGFRRGPGRFRQVEQLDSALVAEGGQSVAELFERRTHRQAGPGAHIGDGGGTKGREVAKHELLSGDRVTC